MAHQAKASAPGKVILMGEHAAVYGIPALVAAVDLRTEAEAELLATGASPEAAEGQIRVELPDLDVEVARSTEWIVELGRRARERWEAFDRGNHDFAPPSSLLNGTTEPGEAAAVYVQLAVAAALAVARPDSTHLLRRVRVRSAAPVGAGFGSSAAVASTVIATVVGAFEQADALAIFIDDAVRGELIEGLALQVERLQHGRPSGVDTAAVRRGGVLRMERSDGSDGHAPGKLVASPVPVTGPVLEPFVLVHTGTPAESTGAVVDVVRRRREAEPLRIDGLFEQIAACTEHLDAALRVGASKDVPALLRASQRALEQIGVVPDPVRALVRKLEGAGLAAKVSGAGSLEGPGAGALLVYDPDDVLSGFEFGDAFGSGLEPRILRPRFGAPGLSSP